MLFRFSKHYKILWLILISLCFSGCNNGNNSSLNKIDNTSILSHNKISSSNTQYYREMARSILGIRLIQEGNTIYVRWRGLVFEIIPNTENALIFSSTVIQIRDDFAYIVLVGKNEDGQYFFEIHKVDYRGVRASFIERDIIGTNIADGITILTNITAPAPGVPNTLALSYKDLSGRSHVSFYRFDTKNKILKFVNEIDIAEDLTVKDFRYDEGSRTFIIEANRSGTAKNILSVFATPDGYVPQTFPEIIIGDTFYFPVMGHAIDFFNGKPINIFKQVIMMVPSWSGNTEIAFCITANCEIDELPTYNAVADIAVLNLAPSNKLVSQTDSESPPSVIIADVSGKIMKTQDLGKSFITETELSKTSDISTAQSLAYSPEDGMLYLLGVNSNNQEELLTSESGYFWENDNIPSFSSISSTPNSYCAIESSGQIWCWGSNDQNKLGLGESGPITPARLLIPAKTGVTQGESGPLAYQALVGGTSHMCALRSQSNRIDCWGNGGSGELGDGIVHDANYSTAISTPINMSSVAKVDTLVAGGLHTCILSNGQPNCWGSNLNKEIDSTSLQTIFVAPHVANYNQPFSYTGIAAGNDFTCAITLHQINCWGNHYNLPYQAMHPSTPDTSFDNFVAITAAGQTVCVLSSNTHDENTNAWCWGDNQYGQLGNAGSGGFVATPQKVISNNLGPLYFKKLFLSGINTCGLLANNNAYCWGNNQYLQTGVVNSRENILEATTPISLNGAPGIIENMSLGIFSTCLIAKESGMNNTYCFGDNSSGQLGIGTKQVSETQPSLVNQITIKESP